MKCESRAVLVCWRKRGSSYFEGSSERFNLHSPSRNPPPSPPPNPPLRKAMSSMTPAEYVRLRLHRSPNSTQQELNTLAQHEQQLLAKHRAIITDEMDYDERMARLRVIVQEFLDHPPRVTVEQPPCTPLFPSFRPSLMLPPAPVRKPKYPLIPPPGTPFLPATPLISTNGIGGTVTPFPPFTPFNQADSSSEARVLLSPVFQLGPPTPALLSTKVKDEELSHSTDTDADSEPDQRIGSKVMRMVIDQEQRLKRIERKLERKYKQRIETLEQQVERLAGGSSKRKGGATRYSDTRKQVLISAWEEQISLNLFDERGHPQLPDEEAVSRLAEQTGLTEALTRKWWANRQYAGRKKARRQEKRQMQLLDTLS